MTQAIKNKIIAEAKKQGVDPYLALAIAQHESGFNPNAKNLNTNGTWDRGVFQLNSAYFKLKNPFDVDENIKRGIAHLKALTKSYGSNIDKILAAYNAGSGAVNSGRIPRSTRTKYVPSVKGIYNQLQGTKTTNTTGSKRQNDMASEQQQNTTSFDVGQLMQQLRINPTMISNEQMKQIVDKINSATTLTQTEKQNVIASITNEINNQKQLAEQRLQAMNQPSITIPQYDQFGKVMVDEQGKPMTQLVSPLEYQRVQENLANVNAQMQALNTQEAANTANQNVADYTATQQQQLMNAYNQALANANSSIEKLRQFYQAGGYQPNSKYIDGLGDRMAMATALTPGLRPSDRQALMQSAQMAGNVLEQQNMREFKRNLEASTGMPYEVAVQLMQAEQKAAIDANKPYLEGIAKIADTGTTQYGTVAKEGVSSLGDIYKSNVDLSKQGTTNAANLMKAYMDNTAGAYSDYAKNRATLANISADAAVEYDRLVQNGKIAEAQAVLDATLANANNMIRSDIANANIGADLSQTGINNATDLAQTNALIRQRQAEQASLDAYRLQKIDQAERALNNRMNTDTATASLYVGGANSPAGQRYIMYTNPSLGQAMFGDNSGMTSPQIQPNSSPTNNNNLYLEWINNAKQRGIIK